MFKKTKEDFICTECGEAVSGNGYTNHCPHCLWSKHVDVEPGDRLADCGGMMEPIGLEKKSEEYSVIQKCVLCGHTKPNKLVKGDNLEKAIELLEGGTT